MKSLVSLGSCALLLLLVVSGTALAGTRSVDTDNGIIPDEDRFFAAPLVTDPALTALSKVDGDTLTLFGGPGTTQGKFQLENGVSPSMQDWTGVDETDSPVYWHVDPFNAENLNSHGVGNHAMWCGKDDPGWVNTPGYGNNWNDILIWSFGPISDPAVAQTVGLDFYFNHDTEPGYDFFIVEYDSAGAWTEIYARDGTNKDSNGDFLAPGVHFATVGAGSIVFVGNDYAGENGDEIRIRLRVQSDGGWSDQDGLWATTGGAVEVDDISVTYNDGTTPGVLSFEDFESAPYAWVPEKGPFAGDFAKVFARFSDIDPCRGNDSPVMTFIDNGDPPSNAPLMTTGGTTSPNWGYGVTGGWVVNYNGGITFGEVGLINSVWSPVIAWDLPTTLDDTVEWAGARERHDVWGHLPLENGMFWSVEIRSSTDNGVSWTAWRRPDRGGLWYGGPSWFEHDMDISEVLEPGLTHLQMRFVCRDYADIYAFPGADATPAPVVDNIRLYKHRLPGPVMSSDWIYVASDGFPVVGNIDVSTADARGALDIPFDRVADVASNTAVANIPGDSITVDVQVKIPGTTLTDHRMVWILDKNPLFEDAIRAVPARGGVDENVDTTTYPGHWYGEVVGRQSTTSAGVAVEDRYFYDLPDVDFMYPGDRLRYYIRATDSDGRTSTFPADVTGFLDGVDFNLVHSIKGLPSIRDVSGTQPRILLVNDFGFRGGHNDFYNAFGQNGYVEGVDYDIYNVTRPDNTWNSNGIGSPGAHGANADQLRNYEVILYETGNLSSQLMSDGSNDARNQKDDTIGVLTTWFGQPAHRALFVMGDNLCAGTGSASAAGAVFVSTLLGVNVQDRDVRDEIELQTTPIVQPLLPVFSEVFCAYGGCLGINTFDSIQPLAPAVRGHGFVSTTGPVYENIAASVVWEREVDGFNKTTIAFPYSLIYWYNVMGKTPGAPSSRAVVLRELLDAVGNFPASGPVVGTTPSRPAMSDFRQYPNPFNPATTIAFTLGKAADTTVRVFTLRGELVSELHNGVLRAGPHEFVWKGVDRGGASVASGVYLVEVKGPGFNQAKKVALVR